MIALPFVKDGTNVPSYRDTGKGQGPGLRITGRGPERSDGRGGIVRSRACRAPATPVAPRHAHIRGSDAATARRIRARVPVVRARARPHDSARGPERLRQVDG